MLAVSDAELMRTAGLDALIFHRAFTFGILFFGPVTILSCVLRACYALMLRFEFVWESNEVWPKSKNSDVRCAHQPLLSTVHMACD